MTRSDHDALLAAAVDEAAAAIIRDGRTPSVAGTLAALQRLTQRVTGLSRDYTLLNLRTVEQAAAELGVSPRTIRQTAAARHAQYGIGAKVGGAWLFTAEEIGTLRPRWKPQQD